jgi:hypothetical protein
LKKYILILVAFIQLQAFAQFEPDTLIYLPQEVPVNFFGNKFDKQINTFYLNSRFFYENSFDNFLIKTSENYSSTLIRSTEKNIRDEHHFNFSTAYKFTPGFNAGISLKNNILSDSRRIEINQASISNAALFTRLMPHEAMQFTPFAGYSNNRQIGENDYGYIYGIEGIINSFRISDFYLDSELRFNNEDISPRKNALRYINVLTTNQFSSQVSNLLNIRYSLNRKDFYYEADSLTSSRFNVLNNIQSRIETNYNIQEQLTYRKFLDIFTLDFLGKLAWRTIDRDTRYRLSDQTSTAVFDTKINELRIDFESVTSYYSDRFNGSFKFIYSERDEQHITKEFEGINRVFFEERSRNESRKNNRSVRSAVSVIGNWLISSSDRLSFSLFQNKLVYDTPSNENFDDRDELLSIARIRYSKLLTPFFEAYLNLEGTHNHTVYLFAERSSNNNVNRIIKLASGGNYSGKNVSSYNNFEVSANYSVYDFEDINPNIRSFSFRQYTASDSTTIILSKNYPSIFMDI